MIPPKTIKGKHATYMIKFMEFCLPSIFFYQQCLMNHAFIKESVAITTVLMDTAIRGTDSYD